MPQVALNWWLRRPTVSTLVIGARNEEQLRQNLAALSFTLNPSHMRVLETASEVTPITPYWHQRGFVERNPFPT